MSNREFVTHHGGCHCGRVRYEVDAAEDIVASECDCSICSMSGYLHLIVPTERFRLLQGEESLNCYRFNTGIARHYFCRHCGVKSFYVPRSHPDRISTNVRCLDRKTVRSVTVSHFDGRNWEDNIDDLRREIP